jgi:TIR domain
MSSLAELPELVGFFSYSRKDDEQTEGALSRLRARIYNELRLQLGRDFRLWQDVAAIPDGALWEAEIRRAVVESAFFIPIVTPSSIASRHCKFEFDAFLEREAALGRNNLIFPILYIRVPALESEAIWRRDDLLKIIGARQYTDWRSYRHRELASSEVAERVEQFCGNIFQALHQPWISPDERARREAAEARERAEAAERAKIAAEAERQRLEEEALAIRAAKARERAEAEERARIAAEAERQRLEEEAATQRESEARAVAAAAAEAQRRSLEAEEARAREAEDKARAAAAAEEKRRRLEAEAARKREAEEEEQAAAVAAIERRRLEEEAAARRYAYAQRLAEGRRLKEAEQERMRQRAVWRRLATVGALGLVSACIIGVCALWLR